MRQGNEIKSRVGGFGEGRCCDRWESRKHSGESGTENGERRGWCKWRTGWGVLGESGLELEEDVE